MKFKFALLLFIVLAPAYSFAQGCITVFSEDGDKFYLVLNGVKQNPMPQTNVRIDGLPNDYYSAKILFAEPGKPEISKNIPVKDPGTNQFAEVTYKIKRTKDGELKLRYFGATPVPVNYNPPPDMYIMHYGQPAPVTTVTETTVTTTSNPNMGGNGSISIGVGGMGVNMNVNVNDPNMQQTTTTTTTSYSQTTTNHGGGQMVTQQVVPAGCPYPMDWQSYKSAKATVAAASFEETKLSTAKSILSSNCFSTDQVQDMCRLFGFEASKLEFAKFAYSRTTDPGNYFKVNNVFNFDASKAELNEYISNGR